MDSSFHGISELLFGYIIHLTVNFIECEGAMKHTSHNICLFGMCDPILETTSVVTMH